jgi:hypothetical protein
MNAKSKYTVTFMFWMIGISVLLLLLIYSFIPRLNINSRPSQIVKQRSQLHSFDTAIDFFKSDFNDIPPSDAMDSTSRPYCGAMKLAEAMMGQDLRGFHPNSIFRSDGTDNMGAVLYPQVNDPNNRLYQINISARKGPYLPLENANAYQLKDLFEDVGPFDGNNFVLCDVFRRVTNLSTGQKIGVPILYYRADSSKTAHDIKDPNNPDNIYNYKDNQALLALGVPGQPGKKHPLYEDPTIFYKMTRDYRLRLQSKPNNADTYILLSAGKDGLYGTKDDLANFNISNAWKK